MCSGLLCCVCGLISQGSCLFSWLLIRGLLQLSLLSLVADFQFFNSHFHVTALGVDLFAGVYLSKFSQ